MHAPPSRPLLLLMDGHSSHFNPSTISKAAEESVIIFCLPPHTTHLTQPLDKGCFGPLKMCWREECKKYLSDNPGRVITRFQFSELFGRAWMRGMSMKNVIAGFHTTGIFPFNRHALQTKDVTSKFDPSSLSKKTGLKYIPFYSPVRRSLAPVSPSTPTEPVFTTQETTCFERRFSEGYDLKHDERYSLWLKNSTLRNFVRMLQALLLNFSRMPLHIHLPRMPQSIVTRFASFTQQCFRSCSPLALNTLE